MAKVATRIPTLHPSPINAAQMDVAKTDSTMPRMVFEGPNKGWPSTKRAPPSSGRANATPRSFLAATAVPLATTSRISNCSNREPCIIRPSAPPDRASYMSRPVPWLRRLLIGQSAWWHEASADFDEPGSVRAVQGTGETRTDLIAKAPVPERQNAKLDETEARSAQFGRASLFRPASGSSSDRDP